MKMFAAAAVLSIALAAPVFAQETAKGSGPPATASTEAKPGAEDVVISGPVKRATSPDGDPRSVGEKRENRQRFDRCVISAPEPQMYDPVGSSPEEYCRKRLGMEDANAVPNSVKTPSP